MSGQDITHFTSVDHTSDPAFFLKFLDQANKIPVVTEWKLAILDGLRLRPGMKVLDRTNPAHWRAPRAAERPSISRQGGGELPGVICELITQKFCEGADIEEIARDWNPQSSESVPVPRIVLEVFRYHLLVSYWRSLELDACGQITYGGIRPKQEAQAAQTRLHDLFPSPARRDRA